MIPFVIPNAIGPHYLKSCSQDAVVRTWLIPLSLIILFCRPALAQEKFPNDANNRIPADSQRVDAPKATEAKTAAVAKLAAATMPDLGPLPPDRVLVALSERMPSAERWMNEGETLPAEYTRFFVNQFLLSRVPKRYDDWGIRDEWKSPVLLRMAADVQLPQGNYRWLLRARGLSRLWIDGALVATTAPAVSKQPDGEQPITPLAEPPLPGLRVKGYRQQEVITPYELSDLPKPNGQLHRVVWEVIIGGPSQRSESGEICIAFQNEAKKPFHILAPAEGSPLPLTDEAIVPNLHQMEMELARMDDATRRQNASSMDAFWEQRHAFARQWVESQKDDDVARELTEGVVDHFLEAKIAKARAASKASPEIAKAFHTEVLPILRDHCFRCHGEKAKGDLRLHSRESVLKAGESGVPAVVPGKPDASELMNQVRSGAMPPTDSGLSAHQIERLEKWILDGAAWPPTPVDESQIQLAATVNESAFVRRVYLDTVGVPPSPREIRDFLDSRDRDKRTVLVNRLLNDERVADHWISYWQDVLAENPTLINQSMGSTGPFRWFLIDALRDNKPIDRMVTELILMRGHIGTGGSAAFALSGESDSPFAVKSHILASAFLGMELQCARCHDSPYHSTTQRDLYSLAAMLERATVKVPATSRVPAAFFEKKGREALIKVTLRADEPIEPVWPFAESTGIVDSSDLDKLLMDPQDSRERLAMLITAPQNQRFAQVIVNRVWKRLIGAGFVEPVDDWEGREASHPELLKWLAMDLIRHGYDMKHLLRRILTSDIYSREAKGSNLLAAPELRFFNAPDPRRLTAEQIVDSLHVSTGTEIDTEELTFVHDGQRPIDKRQTLGKPTRAWMFASLNNERDRPSLSLPKARAVVDVLESFGWNGNRQKPISVRETDPNVLQPGILSNGALTAALTRASYGSELARLALEAQSPDDLVEELFLRVLSRMPNAFEKQSFSEALSVGFDSRVRSPGEVTYPEPLPALPLVTWFNHLQPETTNIQQEHENRVTQGPPPDPRLQPEWRAVYEDFVWSLVNHREFVWVP